MAGVEVPEVDTTVQATMRTTQVAGEHIQHVLPVDSSGTEHPSGSSSSPVRVDPVGTTTQPVSVASLPLPSGAATQSTLAAISAQLPSALATDRFKVDGSGVTQPVSVASLPLPSGAATQTTLAATLTELQSLLASIGAAADAEASGNGSLIAIAKRLRTVLGTLATQATLSNVDANLASVLATLGDTADGIEAYQDPQTVISALKSIQEYLDLNTSALGNISLQLPGTLSGSNNLRVALLEVDPGVTVPVSVAAGSNKIGAVDLDSDAAIGSAVPATGQLIAGTDGTNARALKLDSSGEAQVDVLTLPSLSAGSALIGQVNLTPQTANGNSVHRVISGASTNAAVVKNGAGQLYGWVISNSNASARFLKIYNKATSPTVGTDTPIMTIPIPGNTSWVTGHVEFAMGIPFSTGIGLAITSGVADSDTGAISANEVVVHIVYK